MNNLAFEDSMRLAFQASEPDFEQRRCFRYPLPLCRITLVFRRDVCDAWVMGFLQEQGLLGLIEKKERNTYRICTRVDSRPTQLIRRLRRYARVHLG